MEDTMEKSKEAEKTKEEPRKKESSPEKVTIATAKNKEEMQVEKKEAETEATNKVKLNINAESKKPLEGRGVRKIEIDDGSNEGRDSKKREAKTRANQK